MSRPNEYREVDSISDPDGVVLVVTERVGTGHLTFRIQKEYEHGGETKHTSYLGRRHIPAIRRLLSKAESLLDIHSERQALGR